MPHNKLTKPEASLYFLGTDYPQDILRITEKYPLFRQLYQEIVYFRFHPRELVAMYSEALQIMDRNAERYMIDELKDQISQRDAAISQKNAMISQKNATISQKDAMISQKDAELAESKAAISQKNAIIQHLLAKLAQSENTEDLK